MEKITELDMTRYLVLKQEDIDTELSPRQKANLESMKRIIGRERMKKGKPYSSGYLVLNLEDNIDGGILFKELKNLLSKKLKVKDIAVALVNAILKAKGNKNE